VAGHCCVIGFGRPIAEAALAAGDAVVAAVRDPDAVGDW
jgi:uncharacterized protein YbjT (DUF2867 family)